MCKGYNQACANMAWQIAILSDRDHKPILENYGTEDDVLEYIINTPDIKKGWDMLDGIAHMICKTYNKSHEAFRADVWLLLIQLMPNSTGNVN